MCTELLWNYPIPLLTMAAANFVAASSNTYERNKYYWEKVARIVDRVARMSLPFAYTFAMLFLFSLDFSDDYRTRTTMFSGFGESAVTTM